jgi:hypothetical protein
LDIEEICKDNGYKSGDLIHYKILDKFLDEGLRLISSNYDINEITHVGHGLVELYLVSFDSSNVDVEDDNAKEDEEYKRVVVYSKDAFWDEVLSVDTDDGNDLDQEEHVESKRVGFSGIVEDEANGEKEDRDEEVDANEEEVGED